MDPRLQKAYRDHLLPLATVITVDVDEAAALVGRSLSTADLVRAVLSLGPRWVALKGTHGDSSTHYEDLLSDGTRWFALRSALVPAATRGAGAMFAAGIAARLALGESVQEAAGWARQHVVAQLRLAEAAGEDGGGGH